MWCLVTNIDGEPHKLREEIFWSQTNSDDLLHEYCYKNGNGVLKMINKSSKKKKK